MSNLDMVYERLDHQGKDIPSGANKLSSRALGNGLSPTPRQCASVLTPPSLSASIP